MCLIVEDVKLTHDQPIPDLCEILYIQESEYCNCNNPWNGMGLGTCVSCRKKIQITGTL